MKRLLLPLFLFLAVSLKAQMSVGVTSSYVNRIGDQYTFNRYINTGLYTNIPIWRQLSITTGCNFFTASEAMMFLIEPWLVGLEGTTRGAFRKGIVEIPADIVIGLTKNRTEQPKVFAHLGYAFGMLVYNRAIYYNKDGKVIQREYVHSNVPPYHTINVEVECRWLIKQKYNASLFVQGRFIGQNYNRTMYWGNHVGIGLRLGINLPKKGKE